MCFRYWEDPDFTEDSKFRFTVPNDESIEPIAKILAQLVNVNYLVLKKLESMQRHLAFEGKPRLFWRAYRCLY